MFLQASGGIRIYLRYLKLDGIRNEGVGEGEEVQGLSPGPPHESDVDEMRRNRARRQKGSLRWQESQGVWAPDRQGKISKEQRLITWVKYCLPVEVRWGLKLNLAVWSFIETWSKDRLSRVGGTSGERMRKWEKTNWRPEYAVLQVFLL